MNNTEKIMMVLVIGISLYAGGMTIGIVSLDSQLEQKNKEYVWLSEITNSLVKGEINKIPVPLLSPKT